MKIDKLTRRMKKKEEKLEERKYKFKKKRLKKVIPCQGLKRLCLVEVMKNKWMMRNDLLSDFFVILFCVIEIFLSEIFMIFISKLTI